MPAQTKIQGLTPSTDWADPGYFSGNSRIGNTVRILVQLVRPPRGHRTLPTTAGSLLILITIGVGTAAFNSGQNILYLALSMLLSTLLVSGLLSWMNFKGCRWRLESGRHFRVGETSPVYLDVENTKRRLPSYSLSFILEAKRGGEREVLELERKLDPQEQQRLQWNFRPFRRGRETLYLKGLVSRYPFGFLKKSIRDSYTREVIVWPARIQYQFSGNKAGRRWLYGHHRRKGEGVQLVNLREYRHGDPLRHIHWKASARMRKLHVRETEQEHHQAFALLIDPSPNLWLDPGQFERMCSFAASLAEDLFKHDQLRTVQVAGMDRVRIGSPDDLYAFLDQLGSLEVHRPEGGMSAPDAQSGVVRFQPGANGLVMAVLEEVTIGQA